MVLLIQYNIFVLLHIRTYGGLKQITYVIMHRYESTTYISMANNLMLYPEKTC